MAAVIETVIKKYIGTAAERAALTTTGLKAGSVFEETDTGLIYKWDGSAWFGTGSGYLANLDSKSVVVSASYTRPADTNAYVANDVVSDSTSSPTNLTIATGLTSGSSCIITGATIRIDIAAVPSGMGGFRVALFNATPTAINDNSAFDVIAADKAKFLGYVDIGTPIDLGSRIFGQTDGINHHIQLTTANLHAQLITKSGYTPSSGDVFTINLGLMEMRS